MTLAFTESNERIKGMKLKEFTSSILEHERTNQQSDFWIVPLRTTTGDYAGWFCWFMSKEDTEEECEHHLQNDKGAVRSFKTVDAAINFYRSIVASNGACLISIRVGLV